MGNYLFCCCCYFDTLHLCTNVLWSLWLLQTTSLVLTQFSRFINNSQYTLCQYAEHNRLATPAFELLFPFLVRFYIDWSMGTEVRRVLFFFSFFLMAWSSVDRAQYTSCEECSNDMSNWIFQRTYMWNIVDLNNYCLLTTFNSLFAPQRGFWHSRSQQITNKSTGKLLYIGRNQVKVL